MKRLLKIVAGLIIVFFAFFIMTFIGSILIMGWKEIIVSIIFIFFIGMILSSVFSKPPTKEEMILADLENMVVKEKIKNLKKEKEKC